MEKSTIISSLEHLGKQLKDIPEHVIRQANINNGWFTPDYIQLAGSNWSEALSADNLHRWLDSESYAGTGKKIGIIMAGNIPFVGLHDLLCVISKGHIAMVKLSSQDETLIRHAISILYEYTPALQERIIITEKLNGIEGLIATGSNNSARYFEYYFRDVPSLIRKNRTSVAVLTGHESSEELTRLAEDIYQYFGLGCRNVTHLLLPQEMRSATELQRLYEAYDKYMHHVHHHKYYNNYMYHKSILLMNLSKHYDNGFMLFQEKEEPHAPIATLNYHYYSTPEEITKYLDAHAELWQCIVSISPEVKGAVVPGTSQQPQLWDYADNINTLEFLNL